jgi:hypothetical protein
MALTNSWVDGDKMLAVMKNQMNDEMMKAAEPVIKKAVEEAEKEMRRSLACMFIAIIDKGFSMDRYGDDLRILVKHERPK